MYLIAKTGLLTLFVFMFTAVIYAQNETDSVAAIKETVQIQAKFPGGTQGWAKYLQQNLRADVGAENLKVKRHQTVRQTVIVSFLVDKEGKISEVTVANPTEVHPALAAEAVRVIKVGPNWIPATVDGEPVIYRQKQSITFEVSAE